MLTVKRDAFSKVCFQIRYLTIWDQVFDPFYGSGSLLFYSGNPEYIVNVDLYGTGDKVKLEEIEITLSAHNPKNMEDYIGRREQDIYQKCQESSKMSFALDLESMKIIERDDFIHNLPIRGPHTFFIFSFLENGIMYCLYNAIADINSDDVYAWLLGYIYSCASCLTPVKLNSSLMFGKQFMQAISALHAFKGDKSKIHISTHPSIFTPTMGDIGTVHIDTIGKVDRLKELVEKARQEVEKVQQKHERQLQLLGVAKK